MDRPLIEIQDLKTQWRKQNFVFTEWKQREEDSGEKTDFLVCYGIYGLFCRVWNVVMTGSYGLVFEMSV